MMALPEAWPRFRGKQLAVVPGFWDRQASELAGQQSCRALPTGRPLGSSAFSTQSPRESQHRTGAFSKFSQGVILAFPPDLLRETWTTGRPPPSSKPATNRSISQGKVGRLNKGDFLRASAIGPALQEANSPSPPANSLPMFRNVSEVRSSICGSMNLPICLLPVTLTDPFTVIQIWSVFILAY